MIFTSLYRALILLAFTHEPLAQPVGCSTSDQAMQQMEKSTKEYVRHQQNHRPSFIDRKLVSDSSRMEKRTEKVDVAIPIERTKKKVANGEEESQRKVDSLGKNEDKKGEGNVDKPATQIRHGRSRHNHFVRQIEMEDYDPMRWNNKAARTAKAIRLYSNVTEEGETKVQSDKGEDRWITSETEETWTETTRQLDQLIHGVFEQHVENRRTEGRRRSEEESQRGASGTIDHRKRESINKLRKVVASRGKVRTSFFDVSENASVAYGRVVYGSANNNEKYGRQNSGEKEEGKEEKDLSADSHLEDYQTYEEDDRESLGNSTMERTNDYEDYENGIASGRDDIGKRPEKEPVQVDIVTKFLRIIENQHLLGENCTAGTDLNLGEGVVDQYAQERFRLEANLAVNRANMLTRLWKYAPEVMLSSEYLLHASVLSMVEFDEDIFAAGNCYDKLQYKDRWLYCPFAHRLQDEDGVLVKDLAIQYKYLSNSSEWFYIARKNAEKVIANNEQFSRGYHTYTHNESAHTEREEDEILRVRYEDGRWSKPYYDCGGGNIWMLTYTVPFFGYINDTYFFKGTSGIDIDLRRVDIDQCPLPPGSNQLNIFAASDKCKKRTTECVAIPGLGFRRGSYRCVCKRGFYYPDTRSTKRYYNGTVIEEEYEKLMMGEESQYALKGVFECLPCAEGCESCVDGSPCVVSLNWLMRTAILILECCVIACLPAVALFTWKYGNVKVVRAASPVLLRVIVLGAFFIYCTTIVMYPRPNVITCTVRVWLREIGFSLTYGALMLKTWRISVIFRVKSAKAVKITDASLLKRLGIIVMIFSVFLSIRTLVAPPVVIVARTADDLKAYLCRTDWWDHSFTTLEVMFLIWGIRLCIVVRKTPSEFNESRFISMAIYNEFLLSVFLNVSMLFLQSPANPDLLYIIFFCHTQLTVTLLLCLIFGSKAYVVFRGCGKEDSLGKLSGATTKFFSKSGRLQGTSNQTNSISLQQGNFTEESDSAMEEFCRFYAQLDALKDKNALLGNHHLVEKIMAMQEAANRAETQVSTIQVISSSMRLNDLSETRAIEVTEARVSSEMQQNERGKQTRATKTCRAHVEKKDVGSWKEETCTSAAATAASTSTTTFVKEATSNCEEVEEEQSAANGKTNDVGVSTSPKPTTEDIGTEVNLDASGKEMDVKDKCKSKSGHARTHAIVINLDDKTRFSEEVTV